MQVSESCVLRGIHGQRINEALGYELIQLSGEITGREYKELFAFAEARQPPVVIKRVVNLLYPLLFLALALGLAVNVYQWM